MKKLLSILLTVMLLLSVCPLGLFNITASADKSGYFYYSISSKSSIEITDCGTSISGNVIIPSTINGYTVTSIGWSAFKGCSSLTSITIPNSVTSISSYAFKGCSGLKRVNITDLAAWCDIAFSDSSANPLCYAKNLYINGLLSTDITIPDTVKEIRNYAFDSCSSLTSITIPNSVTRIGSDAFYDCSGLKRVNITDLAAWCDIAFGDNFANPLHYAKNLYINGVLATDITIPDTVKEIRNYAFDSCSSLTSITIPNSVTGIGSYAFNGCSSLKKIYFSKNLKTVYNTAFESSTGITDVYYEGTEEEWQNVLIQHSNGSLSDATVHFNSTGIPEYTTGDLDGSEGITDADAIYLLMYTYFPEDYPLDQPCDFNGDSAVTDADAVYLLMYTYFPEDYPIK